MTKEENSLWYFSAVQAYEKGREEQDPPNVVRALDLPAKALDISQATQHISEALTSLQSIGFSEALNCRECFDQFTADLPVVKDAFNSKPSIEEHPHLNLYLTPFRPAEKEDKNLRANNLALTGLLFCYLLFHSSSSHIIAISNYLRQVRTRKETTVVPKKIYSSLDELLNALLNVLRTKNESKYQLIALGLSNLLNFSRGINVQQPQTKPVEAKKPVSIVNSNHPEWEINKWEKPSDTPDEPNLLELQSITFPEGSNPTEEIIRAEVKFANYRGERENQFLKFAWRNLNRAEFNQLVTQIQLDLASAESTAWKGALLAAFTILTGRRITEICKAILSSNGNSKLVISVENRAWGTPGLVLPHRSTPPKEAITEAHTSFQWMPLPDAVLNKISDQLDVNNLSTLSEIMNINSAEIARDTLEEYLTQVRRKTGIRAYPAALRTLMFDQLVAKTGDDVTAATILNTTEHSPIAPLYYYFAKTTDLQDIYKQLLQEHGWRFTAVPKFDSSYVGSLLCPTKFEIKRVSAELFEAAIAAQQHFSNDKTDIKLLRNYHNSYVDYVLWVLLWGTGHRPSNPISFASFSIDLEIGIASISDKKVDETHSTRIVGLSPLTLGQLREYLTHLRTLALHARPLLPSLANQLQDLLNIPSDDATLPLLFYIEDRAAITVTACSGKTIRSRLKQFWPMPSNTHRHGFISLSRVIGVFPETISGMAGHYEKGQNPFGQYSTLAPSRMASDIKGIDQLLDEIGVKLLSALPFPERKRLRKIDQQASTAVWRPFPPTAAPTTNQVNIKAIFRSIFGAKQNKTTHLTEEQLEVVRNDLVKNSNYSNQEIARIFSKIQHIAFKRGLVKQRKVFADIFRQETEYFHEMTIFNAQQKKIVIEALLESLAKTAATSDLTTNFANTLLLLSHCCGITQKHHLECVLEAISSNKLVALDDACWIDYCVNDVETRCVLHPVAAAFISHHKLNTQPLPATFNQIYKISFGTLRKLTDQYGNKVLSLDSNFDSWLVSTQDYYRVHLPAVNFYYLQGKNHSTPAWLSTFEAYKGGRVITTNNDLISEQSIDSTREIETENCLANDHIHYETLIRLLAEAPPGQKAAARSVETKNLLSNIYNIINGLQLSGLVKIIYGFSIHLIKNGGLKKETLSFGTIHDYVSSIGRRLLDIVGDRPFLSLEEPDYLEIYNYILSGCKTDELRHRIKIRLITFEKYCQQLGCESVDWDESDDRTNKNTRANVVSYQEYQLTLTAILNDPHLSSTSRTQQAALLIFAMRYGIRSGEALRLRIQDIQVKDEWCIFIRTNQFGNVKSFSSQRQIPGYYWLTEIEKDTILSLQTRANYIHGEKNINRPLFFDANDTNKKIDKNSVYIPVLKRLKHITRTDTRLHDLRHTFVTIHTLVGMANLDLLPKFLKVEVGQWFNRNDLATLKEDLCSVWLGPKHESRRYLHAISCAVGHASVDTTLASYCHLSEFATASHLLATIPVSTAFNEKYLGLSFQSQRQERYSNKNNSWLTKRTKKILNFNTVQFLNKALIPEVEQRHESDISTLDLIHIVDMITKNKSSADICDYFCLSEKLFGKIMSHIDELYRIGFKFDKNNSILKQPGFKKISKHLEESPISLTRSATDTWRTYFRPGYSGLITAAEEIIPIIDFLALFIDRDAIIVNGDATTIESINDKTYHVDVTKSSYRVYIGQKLSSAVLIKISKNIKEDVPFKNSTINVMMANIWLWCSIKDNNDK